MGTVLTLLTMYGWVPLVLGMFLLMPPRRAVLWAFFLSWLFLPMAKYEMPMIPDYTKMSASCYGVLLGVVVFDLGRLLKFRFRWWDLPVLGLTIAAPIMSSLSNGLHEVVLYDPFSASLNLFSVWALPYFLGRMYFTTLADMKVLAKAMALGGLVYVPIVLFEVRFSPQLHYWFYGFQQHDFAHAVRQGGYRPRGFMQSGLMVALWMGCATVVIYCLWRGGVVMRVFRYRIPLGLCFVGMLAATVLCKGVGALALCLTALTVVTLSVALRTRALLIIMMIAAPAYVGLRMSGVWDGSSAVAFVEELDVERAGSLQFRLVNEELLMEKAWQRPWFGWGGWGRNYVYDQDGQRTAVVDGMWILLMGRNGALGLCSWFLVIGVPTAMFVWRFPPGLWFTPSVAPLAGIAMLLAIYQIDCLPNGMESPVFFLLAGGMVSVLAGTEAVEWRKVRVGKGAANRGRGKRTDEDVRRPGALPAPVGGGEGGPGWREPAGAMARASTGRLGAENGSGGAGGGRW